MELHRYLLARLGRRAERLLDHTGKIHFALDLRRHVHPRQETQVGAELLQVVFATALPGFGAGHGQDSAGVKRASGSSNSVTAIGPADLPGELLSLLKDYAASAPRAALGARFPRDPGKHFAHVRPWIQDDRLYPAWFEQTLDENFTKIERNLEGVTREHLLRWVAQSLKAKKIITYKGLKIEAGFATYDRWQRIVYDEPRTRWETKKDKITGIKTKVPVAYTERVEKRSNLPNWHQFYIRYKLEPTQPGTNAGAGGAHNVHGDVWEYTSPQGTGRFQHLGNGNWIEVQPNGSRADFREVARTAAYVELFDKSRGGVSVRLHATSSEWKHVTSTKGNWAPLWTGRWTSGNAR